MRITSQAMVLIVALAALSSLATAAIHRCATADGRIEFQDRPCPVRQVVPPIPRAGPDRVPAGMDPSWFVRPSAATGHARCTELACECNGQAYPLGTDKAHSLAQALYIDGNWHRYQLLVDSGAQETPPPGAPEGTPPVERTARVARAACDVMVAQAILIEDTDKVLRDLRERLVRGLARGFDAADACVAGDETACSYSDDLQRQQALLENIKALRLPRDP